jgi:mycofactocin system creatininase family protein
MTWPEVAARAGHTILAVPVGSTEQHGPHLPLSTDTDVAEALAARLAARRADVLVAPTLAYGSSGEHAGFAGTLSIGQDALELVILELGRSADAFAGVVFVSAHGGNADPLRRAVRRLSQEGRRVVAWSPSADGTGAVGLRRPDAHAGFTETSVLLALAPDLVRRSEAVAGCTRPLADLIVELRTGGVSAVAPNGVLGDPTGASAEAGTSLLDTWAEDLLATVAGWAGWL